MTAEADGPKVLTEPQAWVDVICQACGWNYQLKSNAGRAAKLGKELRTAGGTLVEFERHYGQVDRGESWWWYRDDWRGQRGQRPSVAGITETWGVWALPISVRPAAMGAALSYVEQLRWQQNSK